MPDSFLSELPPTIVAPISPRTAIRALVPTVKAAVASGSRGRMLCRTAVPRTRAGTRMGESGIGVVAGRPVIAVLASVASFKGARRRARPAAAVTSGKGARTASTPGLRRGGMNQGKQSRREQEPTSLIHRQSPIKEFLSEKKITSVVSAALPLGQAAPCRQQRAPSTPMRWYRRRCA
jgi:hypothetical protein